MKFTSNYKSTVFWRTFTKDDTVYIIGLREGTVGNGGVVNYDNPANAFQMELKLGGLFGKTLVAAGHVYANSDEYILTEQGEFISVVDAVSVSVDPAGIQVEPSGAHVYQFFRQGEAAATLTITSTITQTITQSGSTQTTVTTEATDEHGTQIGAKETASAGDKLKLGVELSQQFSDKVTNKISDVVATMMNVAVSTQATYTEQEPIILPAGKLTSLETSWQRRFVTGSFTLGNAKATFDATLGYMSSRADLTWNSPDDLPPTLLSAYMAQNPGYLPPVDLSDGALLREKDSAPVYVIFGGAKFWVPTADVLNRLYGGWGKVVVVADGSLGALPAIPRDGTILREDPHPEVWLIDGGSKRHISSPDVLARYGGWGVVHIVPGDATVNFPVGAPVI